MNTESRILSYLSDSRDSDWRDSKNKFSIGSVKEGKEYIAGRGFNDKKTVSEVRGVLLNIIKVLCISMIVYFAFDHVVNVAVAYLLNHFAGYSLTVTPLEGRAVLQDSTSYVFTFIMTILKYAAVFAIFRFSFHMPTAEANFRPPVANAKSMISSFGFLFVAASVVTFVYSLANVNMAVDYIGSNLVYNQTVFTSDIYVRWILMAIWIVLSSAFIETIAHSSAFVALRQFGDLFAILFSSVLITVMTHKIAMAPIAFVLTFISGVAVVKTKSIYISTLQRILFNVMAVIPYFFRVIFQYNWVKYHLILVACVFAFGVLLLAISGTFGKGKMKEYFTFKRRNIFNGKEFASICFESLLAIIVFAVCILIFVIRFLVCLNGIF